MPSVGRERRVRETLPMSRSQGDRPIAFVSHISEEAVVAEALKTALIEDFLGLLDVFVSSDTTSISAGEEWLRTIEKSLAASSIMIVLCSPSSVARPWINFEAGAAWMRGIPLIPICHGGLAPRNLPVPLSLRQGLSLSDVNCLSRLYSRVAAIAGCREPNRDFSKLA